MLTRTFHQTGAEYHTREITTAHFYPGAPVRYVQEYPFVFNPNPLPLNSKVAGSPLGP